MRGEIGARSDLELDQPAARNWSAMPGIELPDHVRRAMLAPAYQELGRESWMRAREIGGRPDLEWSFPATVQRGWVMHDPVMSSYYEPLSTWEDTTFALEMKTLLEAEGVEEYLSVHVGLGLEVFDSAWRAIDGRLHVPAPDEPFRGRHWVWALGLEDATSIAFASGWPPTWGDRGIGYLAREYFERHVDSVYVVQPAYAGLSPELDAALRAEIWRRGEPHLPLGPVTRGPFARAWPSPNPRNMRELQALGRTLTRWRRVKFSMRKRHPRVHVYDLVDGDRCLGRFHLVEEGGVTDVGHVGHVGGATASIEELWVPPTERRRGVGTVLESEAVSLARWLGVQRVAIPLFEHDAQPHTRRIAESFLHARGYDFEWAATRRPNTLGMAWKSIV